MNRPRPIIFHVAPSLLALVKSLFKICLNNMMTQMTKLCPSYFTYNAGRNVYDDSSVVKTVTLDYRSIWDKWQLVLAVKLLSNSVIILYSLPENKFKLRQKASPSSFTIGIKRSCCLCELQLFEEGKSNMLNMSNMLLNSCLCCDHLYASTPLFTN